MHTTPHKHTHTHKVTGRVETGRCCVHTSTRSVNDGVDGHTYQVKPPRRRKHVVDVECGCEDEVGEEDEEAEALQDLQGDCVVLVVAEPEQEVPKEHRQGRGDHVGQHEPVESVCVSVTWVK